MHQNLIFFFLKVTLASKDLKREVESTVIKNSVFCEDSDELTTFDICDDGQVAISAKISSHERGNTRQHLSCIVNSN